MRCIHEVVVVTYTGQCLMLYNSALKINSQAYPKMCRNAVAHVDVHKPCWNHKEAGIPEKEAEPPRLTRRAAP